MSTPASEIPEGALASIVGEQLSAVVFVQDYVQLQFDGPTLTAITLPVVVDNGAVYQWDTPGFRDKLCARIAKTVSAASVAEDREIRIELDDESSIIISLRPQDYVGPEAAILSHSAETLWVW